ncbi:hypothetical protein GF327_09455 [Candidatus Woesearchaeota archaeon]|nr:hypothetical protein [Candidatus Woesearchaeota archaeon]
MKRVVTAIFVFLISVNLSYAPMFDYYDFSDYSEIPVAGISKKENIGVLGKLRLYKLRSGRDRIYFSDNIVISKDAKNSIIFAIRTAEEFLGEPESSYFVQFDLPADKVSGKSSSSAVFLLTVAVNMHKNIRQDILVSGDIDTNYELSSGGHILIKILAAKNKGINTVIFPDQERKILEKHIVRKDPEKNYFVTKEVDFSEYVKNNIGSKVIIRKDIREILEIMIK